MLTFEEKLTDMIILDDSDYKCIAEKLMLAIGNSQFYNGLIEYQTSDFSSVLRATLIIYRQKTLDPADDNATKITDIVPVWWEFHAYDQYGEQLNGFSWRELRECMI